MPITPITVPPPSRSAEAFIVVETTSPLAVRTFRRASRMTPRSIASRRAARNTRVSSAEMNRDIDGLIA
jgi:hypothetical protein